MDAVKELEKEIAELPVGDKERKKLQRQKRKLLKVQIEAIEKEEIQDESPKKSICRLQKEFRELGIEHKVARKDLTLCNANYSGRILARKFRRRWGYKPKTYCFLKIKARGEKAKVYVLLSPVRYGRL